MKILFIHGSGGMKENWYYQTQYFKDSEAIDLPGHPEGTPCSSIEGYVEWLRGYIDSKGYKDLVLVGHSLGGGVVQLYALRYPENLKAIVLLGTGGRLRVFPQTLDELEEALEDRQAWIDTLELGFADLDPELRESFRQKKIAIGPAVQLNDLLACDKFDIMDKVSEIKMPTLVLVGTEDEMTPVKYSQFLAQKLPCSTLTIIEDGTHHMPREIPDKVNKALEDFFNTLK